MAFLASAEGQDLMDVVITNDDLETAYAEVCPNPRRPPSKRSPMMPSLFCVSDSALLGSSNRRSWRRTDCEATCAFILFSHD